MHCSAKDNLTVNACFEGVIRRCDAFASADICHYAKIYSVLTQFKELISVECWNEVFIYCVNHSHWKAAGGESTFRQICAIKQYMIED